MGLAKTASEQWEKTIFHVIGEFGTTGRIVTWYMCHSFEYSVTWKQKHFRDKDAYNQTKCYLSIVINFLVKSLWKKWVVSLPNFPSTCMSKILAAETRRTYLFIILQWKKNNKAGSIFICIHLIGGGEWSPVTLQEIVVKSTVSCLFDIFRTPLTALVPCLQSGSNVLSIIM